MITGYWARSDGSRTKVHLVVGGKPFCGAKIPDERIYQSVCGGPSRKSLDCKKCIRIYPPDPRHVTA